MQNWLTVAASLLVISMTETDQEQENEVLRRMLKTPPKPRKTDKADDVNLKEGPLDNAPKT